MSYVNHHVDPSRRVAALATTFAVHAGLAMAVITGLKVAGVIAEEEDIPTTVFIEVPEDTSTPEATEQHSTEVDPYTPPVAPRVPIDLPRPPAPNVDPVDFETPIIDLPPMPPARPAPSPSPAFTPVGPRPISSSGWITNDDYPMVSIRREEEGTARYVLQVDADGRVAGCNIIVSTGHERLDRATCDLLGRRGRFDAATDGNGQEVAATYSGQVTWQLPR